LRRAIGHALEFRTWQSLVRRQGCRPGEAVQLMLAFVRAAAQPPTWMTCLDTL